MTWLRHLLGKNVAAWLVWGGLRAVPARASALESVLRMKFLLLFAITLKRRSFRCAIQHGNLLFRLVPRIRPSTASCDQLILLHQMNLYTLLVPDQFRCQWILVLGCLGLPMQVAGAHAAGDERCSWPRGAGAAVLAVGAGGRPGGRQRPLGWLLLASAGLEGGAHTAPGTAGMQAAACSVARSHTLPDQDVCSAYSRLPSLCAMLSSDSNPYSLQDVTGRLQTSANRVLTAVDWPPPAAQQPQSASSAAENGLAANKPGANAAAHDEASQHRDDTGEGSELAAPQSADGGGREAEQRLARWARQLAVFRFAVQDWTERLWQV